MIKSTLFLFTCLIITISQSQTVQSTCVAHDSIKVLYQTDADRLTVKNIFATNSTYKDSIVIQEELSERILNALIAIYNVPNIPERDEVIDDFDLHTQIIPSLKFFFVKADPNEIWIQNIQNDIIPTGNNKIDSLSNVFGLSIDSYNSFGNSEIYHSVTFKSNSNLNLKPLSVLFTTVSGVFSSDLKNDVATGVFDSIGVSLTPNYVELIYSHGWGDCPSGCMYRKFYNFKVYNDCSVEFVGTSQLSVADEKNTEIVSVYPNPVVNDLYIINVNENMNYQIVNLLGDEVSKGQISSSNSINTTELDSGVYFIKIGENKAIKFIKN